MLLLVDLFKNAKLYHMGDEKIDYFNDALATVITKSLRNKILNSPFLVARPGNNAYNFNLADTSGNRIRLSDLKGSVVLMDIWYTGCTGCAEFADRLKNEISLELKNHQQLKIVSICVDKDRSRWMNSIYSGKYSEPGNINLNAPAPDSMRGTYDIPIFKYYGLEGLPFILLVDKKGKIICQYTGAPESSELTIQLKKALDIN
jgi:peroxiredoxin